MRSPRGTYDRSFRGVLLFDYARARGLIASNSSGVQMGNSYFLVHGGDGFRVSIAMAEVAPRFTDKSVLLAYEQDGEELQVGVRLVVPGDDLGGRSILGVTGIELLNVESAKAGQEERPASETLSLH